MLNVVRAFALTLLVCPAFLVAQDACDAPLDIEPGLYEGTTVDGVISGRNSCGNTTGSPSKWFRFTPSSDCSVRVETCGSDFDTVLSVHRDCSNENSGEVACADDTCDFQSRLVFAATANETYLIRVSGHRGAAGAYRLLLSCSESGRGDDCNEAIDIEPGVYHGDTRGLTVDGRTNCGQSGNSPDVWYRYTCEEDCFLTASTCGSAFDTALSIHTDCPGDLWNELTCNDDSCGMQSTVSIAAKKGESYLIRLSGFEGSAGPYTLELSCGEAPGGEGPDLVVGDFDSLEQAGRVGDLFAVSVRTVLCNAGSAPLEWFGMPASNHPFLVFNVYRMMNDRVEHIGQSWVKHGISSSQDNSCTGGCIPFGSYQHLGIGCADIYSPDTNADRGSMGPRHEINPWTGQYSFEGSYSEANEFTDYDGVQLRLQLHDDDVDPAKNPGATYFFELFAFSHDDVDRTNSLAFKTIDFRGEPGGEWDMQLVEPQVVDGPACAAWDGSLQTTFGGEASDDGRCIVLAKSSDNGDGTWHYEYALFNLDMNRAIDSFTVPLGPGTEVSNVEFVAPRHHDGVSNEPWTMSRDASSISWRTESFAENTMANAIRWGTLYNFRFDATSPPTEAAVRLGVFLPGAAHDDHAGLSVAPTFEEALPFERGDADGNGRIEVTDAIFTLDFLFRGQRAPGCPNAADVNDSGRLDLNDGIVLLRWMFLSGSGLDLIGVGCIVDETPSPLIPVSCDYPACL